MRKKWWRWKHTHTRKGMKKTNKRETAHGTTVHDAKSKDTNYIKERETHTQTQLNYTTTATAERRRDNFKETKAQ